MGVAFRYLNTDGSSKETYTAVAVYGLNDWFFGVGYGRIIGSRFRTAGSFRAVGCSKTLPYA